jgi:hypothetical protein
VAGGPLALLSQPERRPEDIDQAIVGQIAEAMLRMIDIPAAEPPAWRVLRLPEIGARQ